MTKVGKVVQDVLVDVGQDQLDFLGAQDCHGDETDVGVLRFRFVRDSEESGIEFSVSVSKVHRVGAGMWRRRGRGR